MKIDVRFDSPVLRYDSRSFAAVARMVAESAVLANRLHLRAYPATPRLYASGVRYKNEPIGLPDKLEDIPRLLKRGTADCLHLSSWLVAELRELDNEDATLVIKLPPLAQRLDPSRGRCFHVKVRRASGRLEDPSKRLGM